MTTSFCCPWAFQAVISPENYVGSGSATLRQQAPMGQWCSAPCWTGGSWVPTAGLPHPATSVAIITVCYQRDPLVKDENDALSDCGHERP